MSHGNGSHAPVYSGTNSFPLADGKTLHMDLGPGDLANRIVTVGAASRAEKIASFFDTDKPVKKFHSSRGFLTFTGFVSGTEVSVVAIGIGIPLMDLFIRESRAIVDGPMIIIRFGTCGGLSPSAQPGSVAVSTLGSGCIFRNPDYFHPTADGARKQKPYLLFEPVPADAALSETLFNHLNEAVATVPGATGVTTGMNVSADSFYSSQGRNDDRFHDDNSGLFDELYAKYPEAASLEMETYYLFHLAQSCKVPIRAAGAAMVISNRSSGDVVAGDVLDQIELVGGRAVLHAVATAAL